jgi:hypothetical protein
MSETLLSALPRQFPAQEGDLPHSAEDFVYEFGDVVSALLYSTLFLPDFIEVEDSILLSFGNKEQAQSFLDAEKKWKKNLSDLESSFNWIEVPYLFSNRKSNGEEDNLLAEKIVESWRYKLKFLFPARTFVISVIGPEVTGSVVGVQFYELR